MKFGMDIDKTVHQAVQPFLDRLDAMQSTLEQILEELRDR